MAERVHRPGPLRRSPLLARLHALPAGAWFVALVAAALVFAVVVSVVVGKTQAALQASILDLPGGDSSHYAVRYEVSKSPLATAECVLVAQDERHEPVGRLTDTIATTSHNQRTTIRTVTIATDGQAVTAVLDSCHLVHKT